MKESLEAFKAVAEKEGITVYDASSPQYHEHTKPWSLAYDRQPTVLLIPDSVAQLQFVIKTLYHTNLDFVVRGRGCGSASAGDVLISLLSQIFQDIKIVQTDSDGLTVDVSAGTDWGDVDAFLEANCPGYAIVGARCPYVGVAGSTLTGGFSWLSHELGISSDPRNLLDVEIILKDGSVAWASKQDPELLWALRGGGGNFGVATKFRFKAHPYSQRPFSGMIFYPESSLRELSAAVARWTNETSDPKTAMHVFIIDSNPDLALHGGSRTPQLVILLFDGHGEKHGRSDAGFKWAFDLEGAKEAQGAQQPRDMSLREVHELQRGGQGTHGAGLSWLAAALVGEGPEGRLDNDFLIRGWDWYNMIVNMQPDLANGSFVLLEVMQRPAFTSGGPPSATGWPHGGKGRQHVLQLSTGSKPVAAEELPALQERALQVLQDAPGFISGKEEHPAGDYLPNFLLPNHDAQAVFSNNWERLKAVKSKYDPETRLKTSFTIPVS